MEKIYRKIHISRLLKQVGELIQENPDVTIAQIMVTTLRPQNINSENKDAFYMSDEDFSSSLESTIDEYKQMMKDGE